MTGMVFHILEEGRGSQDSFLARCALRLQDWCQVLTLAASLPGPSFLRSGCAMVQFRRSSKLPHSLGMTVFSWKAGSVSKDHKDWNPGRIQPSHCSNCCLLLRNWTVCTRNWLPLSYNQPFQLVSLKPNTQNITTGVTDDRLYLQMFFHNLRKCKYMNHIYHWKKK